MKKTIYRHFYLFLSLILFASAAIIETNLSYLQPTSSLVSHLQKKLISKQKQTLKYIEELQEMDSISLDEFQIANKKLYLNDGISLLIYNNSKLRFWSDNAVIPPYSQFTSKDTIRFVKLQNAYYSVIVKQKANKRYLGLILIKNNYQYENAFLNNDFHKDYRFPSIYKLTQEQSKDYYSIKSISGDYLFSVMPITHNREKLFFISLSAVLYLLGILAGLLYLIYRIRRIRNIHKKNWTILAVGLGLFLLRIIMVNYKFPYVFNMLPLFSPYFYANSFLLPSLGDLLFLAIFVFYFSYLLHTGLQLQLPFYRVKTKNTIVVGSGIILIIFFHSIQNMFLGLILNSNILLDMNKIFQLSPYSVLGVLIVSLFWAAFILILDKVLQEFKNIISNNTFLIYWGILLSFYLVTILLTKSFIFLSSFCVLILIIIILYRYRLPSITRKSYSILILMSLLTFYSISFIVYHSYKKEREIRKVLVVNLANERDAAAELIIENQEKQILADSAIMNWLFSPYDNSGIMHDYLQQKYFSGYFAKYELQTIPCSTGDSLDITNTNQTFVCLDYFNEMISSNGVQLNPQSNFYFMDNMTGRISYLGHFQFKVRSGACKSLFVSLDSKLIREELGYPELLLDKKNASTGKLESYSYAKYQNNKLTAQKSSQLYSLKWNFTKNIKSEFSFINSDGYSHLIYKLAKENYIVISRERLKLVDLIVSLSYLLISFYVFLYICLFKLRNLAVKNIIRNDFKTRIKFSMISVLIISFIAVAIGSIFLTIKQFEKKHTENISEKIQSVNVELEHKIGVEQVLDKDIIEFLTSILKKFSQVFYTDINMYDLDGKLLASSLPEIFKKGLISKQMNPEAYRQMVIKQKAQFITKEHVGNMNYYSIYVPFYNDNGKLLAYLNLPYFTKQSELRNELISMAITIINIYIILIVIAIVIAIFLSNKVTKPLRLVQNKIQEISLEDSNELIDYHDNDEVGSLVKEYNRKALELAESAKKLARSERESAWREMAKQIAHEIKNPLTPMKLNIQYFQRAWNDQVPDIDARLERFSKTLIEQINNLSSIATEFSNFAKMPEIKNEKVDLLNKIRNAVNLFNKSDNCKINFDYKEEESIFVYADKEQITRVFINLLKNSMQAIPEGREGEVDIILFNSPKKVIVEIKDNGSGIEESVKLKLFQPNFTTKNSGMGLGLAIVKNIVESCNGKIWYKTEVDKGSSFYVKFSKYEDE